MKRIISLLLIFIMLFSFASCAGLDEMLNGGEGTENENGGNEENENEGAGNEGAGNENEGAGDENTSGGTENEGTTPPTTGDTEVEYGPDRTTYSARYTPNGDKIYYRIYQLTSPTMTPYYNGYEAAISMTFDDGYDTNTGVIVSDIYEELGFRGTMMLGPCFINNSYTISAWQETFERGYLDVGCHGYDHLEPTDLSPSQYPHEIKDAINFLKASFPNQKVATFATPYAHINNSYRDYLSQYAIANRLEAGGSYVYPGQDYDPYRIKAISVNLAHSTGSAEATADLIVSQNGWLVELYHCVLENAVNSTDINREAFESHCRNLYNKYNGRVWFGSFEDVAIYQAQARNTTITYTDADRESMTFEVACSIANEIYDIPMTAQIYVPFFTDSAYAVINGEIQPLEVVTYSNVKYVMVKDIPTSSEGVSVKVYIGGNEHCTNGCRHRYTFGGTTPASCNAPSYSEMECGICHHKYKIRYTGEALPHTLGEMVVESEPTLEANGIGKQICSVCSTEVLTILPKLAPEPPEGEEEITYTLFDDQCIKFMYPDSWEITNDEDFTMILDEEGAESIVISHEMYSDYYEELTVQQFYNEIAPTIDAEVSNVSIGGARQFTMISYTRNTASSEIYQTMFIIRNGAYNYIVTLTTPNPSSPHREQIYNSLTISE